MIVRDKSILRRERSSLLNRFHFCKSFQIYFIAFSNYENIWNHIDVPCRKAILKEKDDMDSSMQERHKKRRNASRKEV